MHPNRAARTLEEETSYINADLCLINALSKSGVPGAVTRWDDLQWPHVLQTITLHNVGAFLPFHRYYMTVHERLVREECGYTGRMPYWDGLAEVSNITASDLWQDQYFGGNGVGQTGCIASGPSANLTLRWEDAEGQIQDKCLSRNFSPRSFNSAAQSNIDECNAIDNYDEAWVCWYQSPHGAGHGGVGKIMADPTLSPGDPVFYLHHAYLDKLWWEWQKLDLNARLTDMDGVNVPRGSNPDPAIVDYFGDGGNITTLNHNLWMTALTEIAPNVTVGDVMDLNGPVICAEYIDVQKRAGGDRY
ncbi:amino acid transporter [Xylariales sp. AK1849]|nr:amino acid transporter [Xylariales sp. AK1849]